MDRPLLASLAAVILAGQALMACRGDPIVENPAELVVAEYDSPSDGERRTVAAVAHSRFDRLTLIDLDTYEVRNVPVGKHPLGIVQNPAAGWVATANRGDGTVSIVDLASLSVATYPVAQDPVALLARSGTSELWVANRGSDSLSIVDTFTGTQDTVTIMGGPSGLAQSPDGGIIYVAGNFLGRLVAVDAATRQVVREYEYGQGINYNPEEFPYAQVKVTADGRYVVATDPAWRRLVTLDTAEDQLRVQPLYSVIPITLTLKSDSRTALVGGWDGHFSDWFYDPLLDLITLYERPDGVLAEVDLATGRAGNVFILDGMVRAQCVSTEGDRVYAGERNGDEWGYHKGSALISLDFRTGRRVAVGIPALPYQMQLARNDTLLVITHGNPLGGVSIVDTHRLEMIYHRDGVAIGDVP